MSLFETPTKYQLLEKGIDVIKTIIFLKIDINSIGNGEISEISAIAVHINEINCPLSYSGQSPRIMDKLSLCFDPITGFHKHISYIKKIDCTMIQNACKKKFDKDAYGLLYSFLKRQEAPICFLCHNGFRLDFQILQSELQKIMLSLDQVDGQDVYCADSMWTFKAMDLKMQNPIQNVLVDVTVFDMMFYTLNSIYARYINKTMPEQLSAEETNLFLLHLVFQNRHLFFNSLCCKRFSFVKPISSKQINDVSNVSLNNSLAVTTDITNQHNDEVQTYVFVDLETSSLRNAKITEICMIAIFKSSFFEAEHQQFPRVQDKLLLVLDPECSIDPYASKISGLSTDTIVANAKPAFDQLTAWTIAQFLDQQSGTICLIAHNGDNFDFSILLSTLHLFLKTSTIFSTLFCADSLKAMKSLDKKKLKCDVESFQNSGRVSYALKNVYERYFPESSENFHNAEADANALIKICCCNHDLIEHLNVIKRPFVF